MIVDDCECGVWVGGEVGSNMALLRNLRCISDSFIWKLPVYIENSLR